MLKDKASVSNLEDYIDSVMNKFFSYESTKLLLVNLEQDDYQTVHDKTKIGIKKGIEDYFVKQKEPKEIDIRDFYYDNSTEIRIKEEITQFNPKLDSIKVYAEDVCRTYASNIYRNSSYGRGDLDECVLLKKF